jgi:phage baseplate assembly protein gpV
MSTTSNTPADLYEYVKFVTGQDNLTSTQANMLFKYAVDSYSHLAMVSDGVHKFDDLSHVNGSGQPTYPIATSTVSASSPKIQLDATFLMLDRVTVTVNGTEKPLKAIDRRDYKDTSLMEVFGDSGVPTHYDYDAHGVEVFPHPDASYTATAYYSRAAKYIDVTDSTTEIGIPRIHHQYLALHVARQLGFRTIDGNRTDVANELAKWEGTPGVKGWIAAHYNQRDEDRPRRLKNKNLSTRTFNRV